MFAKNRKTIIIICLIAIIAIIAGLIVYSLGGNNTSKFQKQYDLGMKYLEEGNYEEAIVAFTAAIEIDPRQADAYLGLAEVYIAQNEFDLALEILQKGYDITADERLKERIGEIESGNISDFWGNVRSLSYYDAIGQLIWFHQYEYDQHRKKTSATSYNAYGEETSHVIYEYDEEGREIVGVYGYSHEDGILIRCETEYDSAGRVVKLSEYYANTGKMFAYLFYTYDENDIQKEECFFPDGTLYEYYIYSWEANGDYLCEEYSADGKLIGYWKQQYDENKMPIAETSFDSEGNVISYSTFAYNSEGRCVRRIYYDSDGNVIGELTYD